MGRITHAAVSDPGRVREKNEDRWFADPRQGLYVVCDGMGGQAAGAVAAEIVVQTLPALLSQQLNNVSDLGSPAARERLLAALAELSKRVRAGSVHQAGLEGMGSTVVLALIENDQALVAHMGDSRAYLLRAGTMEQLTHDHSLLQLLLDCGEVAPDEAADHPSRCQLTRYVGMTGEALPEARLVAMLPGDRLLLCTDGLTNMVSDQELLALLQQSVEPRAACESLVSAANAAGGKDNVTALVIAVADVPRTMQASDTC